MELHFPAEHYVTMYGQTPRAALELQIFHTLKNAEGEPSQTDTSATAVKTNKAIISILFKVGETVEGDMFLNQMGISKFNTNNSGDYNIPQVNKELDRYLPVPATYPVGFNFMALNGLRYILNADKHIFFYYGSETAPPCREDVVWMVFSGYRSFSKFQFDFLNKLIPKRRPKKEDEPENAQLLYGNKRDLKKYDESKRGKILSSQNGLVGLIGTSFYLEDPNPVVET